MQSIQDCGNIYICAYKLLYTVYLVIANFVLVASSIDLDAKLYAPPVETEVCIGGRKISALDIYETGPRNILYFWWKLVNKQSICIVGDVVVHSY